jgi:hypothetical protein
VSETLSDTPAGASEELLNESSAPFNRREKYLTALGAVLCFGIFWLAGKEFRIPTETRFSASLFQQPTLLTTVIVIAIVYGACVALSSSIAGMIGFDAGVFCASAGFCALSTRGGPIRFTLMESPTRQVWLMLSAEVVTLSLIIAAGTLIQRLLLTKGLLHDDDHRHVVNEVRRSIDQRLLALLCNVIVTALCMMLLAESDRKAQVILAVAISSFLGTITAYYFIPTRPSAWYWAAPILVGVIGYGFQYFGNADGWQIGEVRGALAGLARPLPIDYAGAGVAGSVYGYWLSRRWQHQREISTVTGDTEK